MCFAQEPQRSDAGEARTRGPWSRVKHSTIEPLCSQKVYHCLFIFMYVHSIDYQCRLCNLTHYY